MGSARGPSVLFAPVGVPERLITRHPPSPARSRSARLRTRLPTVLSIAHAGRDVQSGVASEPIVGLTVPLAGPFRDGW